MRRSRVAPKEKLCFPPPTVKKLLEQKRKRETTSAGTVSPTAGPSAPTPVQAAQSDLSSLPESMGATGPLPQAAYSSWQSPIAQQSPPSQQEFFFPSTEEYFSSLCHADFSAVSDCSVPMTSSYAHTSTEETYTGMVSMHSNFPSENSLPGSFASFGIMAPHQTPYHWNPSVVGQYQTTGGLHIFGTSHVQMDAGQLETARMFIQKMDISKKLWQDEDGDTILHIYTAKGLREYVYAAAEILRDLGKLDCKEHKGKTPLLVAATANHPFIVQDLLSLGSDVNACDIKGQTALHLAATYGFPAVIQAILSTGVNVNLEARNFEGLTPLHCAVISHSSSMKMLASQDPGQQTDTSLETQAHDKLTCIQLLLQYGASTFSQDIKSNKTVLHLAVKEGNLHLVQHLLSLNIPDMCNFVNMKAHGNTALHMAAGLHGHIHQEEIIRLLLSQGADPSIRNLENDQPAHLLQAGERGEKLKHILKRGRMMSSSRRRIVSL
ncbi:NF-kappa-B inhibitor delta isoform X1 [Polypterus senegalus]|uniref:NF-kappa-B inhibitor delta isoform X1 n=2 Tax=Polypterus senegalus TaxID=55291 RepID=UPI001964E94D|nr:NF-kappa-B inhibitor delta isoform X1 [Polypterus senegalus]